MDLFLLREFCHFVRLMKLLFLLKPERVSRFLASQAGFLPGQVWQVPSWVPCFSKEAGSLENL